MLTHISGLPVFASPHLTVGPFEDWTRVRSPARARRRRKRGHRQNVTLYTLPDPNLFATPTAIYGHPDTLAKVAAKLSTLARPEALL